MRRCLPEQHEENKKVRSLVHTALDPALHMLTPHNVRFRDKFYAVDEAKKPVKESFSTLRCVACPGPQQTLSVHTAYMIM